MNRKLMNSLFLMMLMAAVMLLASVARADSITLTLDNPNQNGAPGQTLSFTGTITADAGNSADFFLNSIQVNFGLGGVDSTPFFLNTPFSLAAGQSSGDVELFTIFLDPSTAYNIYPGTAQILGGVDGSDLSQSSNLVPISVAVPEPSSMLLLGSGLTGMVGVIRRKLQK